jgi:CHAD domain-containing protein
MSDRFQLDDSLADAVPRIACQQVDRAIAELTDLDIDANEAVHQVRKRCKKIRGLLRLVRGSFTASYQQENVWFRDLARRLSGVRDSEAMLECLDKLLDAFSQELDADAFATVRRALTEQRTAVHEGEDVSERIRVTAAELQEARIRVLGWRLDNSGFAVIQEGLLRTYRRGRKAMRFAYETPTPENFHEWRKRVKYHWYHLRLLRELWPAPMKPLAAETKWLADLLGDDHDLAVLLETLVRDGDTFGSAAEIDALRALGKRRQDQLRTESQPLGWRLFAEKPGNFGRRMERYWRAAERDAARIAGLPEDGVKC